MKKVTPKPHDEEIAGYVRINRVMRLDYESRFKVTISTPVPDTMRHQLESCLPDQKRGEHKSLPILLDEFFYCKQTDQSESADWLFYEAKETDQVQDDRILKAINTVREEERKEPLKWTHLAVFIASKTKISAKDVEMTLQDWINNDLLPEPAEGELSTWITVTPVNMLPDEYSKKGKKIPIPARIFDELLTEENKDNEAKKK